MCEKLVPFGRSDRGQYCLRPAMNRPLDAVLSPDFALIASALDGMCVGLVLTNAAGRVTWANRAAQAVLAFDLENGRNRPLSQLLRDPNMAEFWHRAANGPEVTMEQISMHWPVSRHLKANATQCKDADGDVIGRALLFCDVTQERSLQLQLSAEATQRLLDMTGQQAGSSCPVPHAGLTPQELKILRCIGRGLGNKQVAQELHVAATTVRSHLKHLYSKLGLQSRNEAIAYALRHGLC